MTLEQKLDDRGMSHADSRRKFQQREQREGGGVRGGGGKTPDQGIMEVRSHTAL